MLMFCYGWHIRQIGCWRTGVSRVGRAYRIGPQRACLGIASAWAGMMLVCLIFASGLAAADLWPRAMLEDAELTDVTFIDSELGWAVGDRGVIWHTDNGGRHWQLQRSAVACRLESVCFVDKRRGWVVGGRASPYTHQTGCVVLRTHDGGRTWTTVDGLTLPWLKYVQFLDASRGWAVGAPSAMYPTGVFRTDDGGLSWTPLPAGQQGTWLTAAFYDMQHGVAAGHDGRLAVIATPSVARSKTPDLGRRPLRRIRMLNEQQGWLVGDGGLLLQTADGGRSWQLPVRSLPAGVADLFDFRAVALSAGHLWIAGAPGTCVIHSADGGKSWDALRTGQNAPIQSLSFFDAQHGWAVGALGTILVTRDAGQSWRLQHSGGTRLALLGVFSEPSRIPLELFAYQSGNEGYLGYAELLGRRANDPSIFGQAPAEDLGRGAMMQVGASGAEQAWQFPLRQLGLELPAQAIIRDWDRANDGRAVSLLEQRVVRQIRQWQPDVIVTEPPSPLGDRPLAQVVNQIVLAAVQQASDPTMYPEQLTVGGLQPWEVQKVFSSVTDSEQSTVNLTTAQLVTRLGKSIADQAEIGYGLTRSEYLPVPVRRGYRLLLNRLPQAAGQKDIFSGIHLQAGGEARRQLGPIAAGDIKSLTRAAQKRRNIQQLLEKTPENGSQPASAWLGQLTQLTQGLSPSSAGQLLFQLAQRYRTTGQSELAAQALERLVERFPDDPLTESALVWLVRYYSSSEVSWQLRRQTRYDSRAFQATASDSSALGEVQQADFQERDVPHRKTLQTQFNSQGTVTTAGAGMGVQDRATMALECGKRIQRLHPQLYADPRVQFPLSVAYRQSGLTRDAERFYHRLSAMPGQSKWAASAQAELWLSHGRGQAPKKTHSIYATAVRPHLDGRLDDAVWKQATVLELKSPHFDDDAWPGAVMLAYDDQFLFLAVSCRKAPGRSYPSTPGPRPRDPDLTHQDRVDLLLDVDRDYGTYYRLTVDQRGWTGEACAENVRWNPTWYVAAFQTEQDWCVEAAISIGQLVSEKPDRSATWAFGVQRTVPGVGFQSYSQPAAIVPRPEGFALLVFQ